MRNRSLILVAALLSAPALAAISEPSGLTARLRAPATEEPAFVLSGSGVYIYECMATVTDPNAYAWHFLAPDATLYEGSRSAGRHASVGLYESTSDRTSVSGVVRSTQGAGAANLPWALLRAQPLGQVNGRFTGVTSIQRVNTSGGAPPTTGCDATTLGTEHRASFNADYYFYKQRGAS